MRLVRDGREPTQEDVTPLDFEECASGPWSIKHEYHVGRRFRFHMLMRGPWVLDDDLPLRQKAVDTAVAALPDGKVLVLGIGIGYAVKALLRYPGVEHVRVVEQSEQLIRMVEQQFTGEDSERLTIVCADEVNYLEHAIATGGHWDAALIGPTAAGAGREKIETYALHYLLGKCVLGRSKNKVKEAFRS